MSREWIRDFGDVFGYDRLLDFLEGANADDIALARDLYGMSLNESHAVYAYTLGVADDASPFRLVNDYLRTRPSASTFAESLIQDIESALLKIPATEEIVFRKLKIPSSVRANVAPGVEYADQAFLSTSTDPSVFDGQDIMIIQSKFGRRIREFSAFPQEDEVLFMPETRFRITSVDTVDRGLVLELEDV